MPGNNKLVLDTFCEVYDLLKSQATAEFWDFGNHSIVAGATYVFGREQFKNHVGLIKQLALGGTIRPILSNPAEGSETLARHCALYGVEQLIKDKKILLVGGGAMDDSWPCLEFDSFLPKILDYEENITEIQQYQEHNSSNRPYKFLFLNGRYRPHRKYLLQRLNPLLDDFIWTNLDSNAGPIKLLDNKYEHEMFANNKTNGYGFVKAQKFNNLWGEIYLKSQPYCDTYFSLVTETVFDYPYSFRTEKIWKPIAIGHPWIAVANAGYYQDLHNLGFQTFDPIIDESFDQINDNQLRLERIADLVEDLCRQDLASLSRQCYTVCKYNQQHLAEMKQQVRQKFPERFQQFIKKYHFDE